MPIYKYKGYRAGAGQAARGTLEAESPSDATRKLKSQGIIPTDVTEQQQKRRRALLAALAGDGNALASVTRRLSVLVHTGVPLVEALRAVSMECPQGWRPVLVTVRERVAQGSSLARAMQESPGGAFPDFYCNMVAAGEQGGSLDKVLEQLADYLESQSALQAQVRTAMIYPAFMALVSAAVLVLMLAFVVPKIARIFEHAKTSLPLATVLLMWASAFFQKAWWAIAGVGIIGIASWRGVYKKYRARLDRSIMHAMPSLYLARFARTLGMMLEGGIPMLKSLELAGKSAGNAWLEAHCAEAARKVSEGAGLSASLAGLPPVMLELVSTGERSGALGQTLQRAAETYEAEFKRTVQRSLALLEPVMVVLMGGFVAFVAFAVLLPMFQLNQLIR